MLVMPVAAPRVFTSLTDGEPGKPVLVRIEQVHESHATARVVC
jgi:predicted RNA-binding protein with TRAM domain